MKIFSGKFHKNLTRNNDAQMLKITFFSTSRRQGHISDILKTKKKLFDQKHSTLHNASIF
jgi:hypothetical protein